MRNQYKPRSIRRREGKFKKNILMTSAILVILAIVLVVWGLPFVVGSLSIFNRFKDVEKQEVISGSQALPPPVLNIPFEATNQAQLKQ